MRPGCTSTSRRHRTSANILEEKQKIAAFGSSYRGSYSSVGAAEGCDLLILKLLNQSRKSDS
ncbi:hypothetical protein EMIT0P218_10461 [Pseudomonas sp. IT-P218]